MSKTEVIKAEKSKPDEKPNKLTLSIVTLSGNYSDEFNVHQKLQHVVDATFKELGIQPAPGEEWLLKNGDTTLTLTQTIEDAKLQDGTTLMLAPREGGGGTWTAK